MTAAGLRPSIRGLDEPPVVDPDDVRRTADDILSRSEYAEPSQTVLDRALEWVFERMGDAFARLGGSGPGAPIGWIFVVALVAAAAWLVWKAVGARPGRRRPDEPTLRYGTETVRDPQVWRAEADRLAGDGDFVGALRCRHQALVAALITGDVVDDLPGRTAAEYARVAAVALPDVRVSLAELSATFDAVWYGGESVGRAEYERFTVACESVEAASVGAPA